MKKAKEFKRWVTSDVLPEIRKTGSYSLTKQLPQTFAEALRLAADQQEEIERQQLQIAEKNEIIEEQKPAVEFSNRITSAVTDISVGDFAKLLCQNGVDIGQNRLFDWFCKKKYIFNKQRWSKKKGKYENNYRPYQDYMDLGIFSLTEVPIKIGDSEFIKFTIRITPKGQQYFLNKFLNGKTES